MGYVGSGSALKEHNHLQWLAKVFEQVSEF